MCWPYRLMRVQGYSMSPTLQPGDLVLVDCRAYRAQAPHIGEVVAARPAALAGKAIIKRVSAVSGQACFLVGDNLSESLDSRALGPIPRNELIGAVRRRLWPLKPLQPPSP